MNFDAVMSHSNVKVEFSNEIFMFFVPEKKVILCLINHIFHLFMPLSNSSLEMTPSPSASKSGIKKGKTLINFLIVLVISIIILSSSSSLGPGRPSAGRA